ncbi:MAG: hypothetical protein M1370_04980 [Bacteroidetes bacterium]|nr:hypothetical protein [Bacteroidota bacterium]MCL5026349.1 hypothetical protein [Chloroflexota bacterium]
MPEKYEREIEELLRQIGDLPSHDSWTARLRRTWDRSVRYLRQRMGSFNHILTPGNIIKTALILLVASFILRAFMPRFSVYAYLIGLVLLVVGIAGFVLAERAAPEQRWRGRIIELPGSHQEWWRVVWDRWRDFWRRPGR